MEKTDSEKVQANKQNAKYKIKVGKMNFFISSLRIFPTDKAKHSEDSRNVIPYLTVFRKLKYLIYSKHR